VHSLCDPASAICARAAAAETGRPSAHGLHYGERAAWTSSLVYQVELDDTDRAETLVHTLLRCPNVAVQRVIGLIGLQGGELTEVYRYLLAGNAGTAMGIAYITAVCNLVVNICGGE